MKKTEKIVYKANTKLIKRILLGMLILFIACIFAKPVKNGIATYKVSEEEERAIAKAVENNKE